MGEEEVFRCFGSLRLGATVREKGAVAPRGAFAFLLLTETPKHRPQSGTETPAGGL
jgi:hypothetical protein